jgi:hypothetical protein
MVCRVFLIVSIDVTTDDGAHAVSVFCLGTACCMNCSLKERG